MDNNIERTNCREIILSEEYADFIVDYEIPSTQVLERYNAVCYQEIDVAYSTVYVPLAEMNDLSIRNYPYKSIPTLYGLMDTVALEETGILRLQNQPTLELRGQGTIIGIIDTGIDYSHKAFLDETGRSRILGIWDQSDNSGKMPDGFNYGSEYQKTDIDRALLSDNPLNIVPVKDTVGHGTFLAGVAGGSKDDENDFVGIAPECKFVIVKLKEAKRYLREYYLINEDVHAYQENDIMAAIGYVRQIAANNNMPLSILLGVGSNRGGHTGSLPLSSSINDFASKIGSAIVVAGGNEGDKRSHYEGRIEEGFDTMEIRVGEDERGFMLEIWGDNPNVISIDIQSPEGEIIPRIPARIGESDIYYTVFGGTMILVEYGLVEQLSGDEIIIVRFENPTEGVWKINVYGDENIATTYNSWLPVSGFISDETYFLEPDADITITTPGDTFSAITVSSYSARNNAFAIDSGRGFLRNNFIKPDIASPGVELSGPGINNDYVYRSGTSVAAAVTAGAAALFLTWGIVEGNYNIMNNQVIKSYLIRGAVRENEIIYPNRQCGYGKLNVYNSFLRIRGD